MKNVMKNDATTRRIPGVGGSLASFSVVAAPASSPGIASFKTSTHILGICTLNAYLTAKM